MTTTNQQLWRYGKVAIGRELSFSVGYASLRNEF